MARKGPSRQGERPATTAGFGPSPVFSPPWKATASTEAEAKLWLDDHPAEWDLAVVDLVLGLLIAFMEPTAAIYFLTFFVSASLILRGIWSIALAMDLKRLSHL